MRKNNYKYVVSIGTEIFPNLDNYDNFDYEPIRSTNELIEFNEDNLFLSREKALERAHLFITIFKEQPHKIPTMKWNEIIEGNAALKEFWMNYQIQVFLKDDNDLSLCIFDDGDGINDQTLNITVFEDLIKEAELYKKLKLNSSSLIEKIVIKDWEKKYFEWENSIVDEVEILSNGENWAEPNFTKNIGPGDLDLLSDSIENEDNKIQKNRKKNNKIEFKTTSIHKIKVNLDNVEISVKTTSDIPLEIQNELLALIDKWKKII